MKIYELVKIFYTNLVMFFLTSETTTGDYDKSERTN